MAKVNEEKEQTFEGCYGEKVVYDELVTFLGDAFAANRDAEESGSDERFATCIWGHSGIGKTAIVKQHCNQPVTWNGKKYPGYRVIDVPLAQFEEMGDLHGMPSRYVKVIKNGDSPKVERWVPEEVVQGYLEAEWQLVYDAMIAQGRIDADTAARGGRGMEAWMSCMSHLDSWDVIGQYHNHVVEVENHFDVPIQK